MSAVQYLFQDSNACCGRAAAGAPTNVEAH